MQQLPAQQAKWLWYEISGEIQKIETISIRDSLHLDQVKNQILSELYQNGFLVPQSQIRIKGDTLVWNLSTGEKFEWLNLRLGNIDPQLLVKAGIDLWQYQNRPVNINNLKVLFENLLTASENQGFPFASVKIDSLERQGQKLSGALDLNLGPLITFDTLKITGDSRTKRLFLARFTQINPGEPFSQKRVNNGIRQIKNLPYLKWSSEPELSFQNEEATLYLPLSDRRINSIDGIIGLLPNELEGGRMLVTGQFDLALYNVAGRGRNYELNWQRFNQFSQSLQLSALEPLVLGSAIDIKADFSLLKEDTTFLNRDFRLSFGYRVGSGTYVKVFSGRQAGDLLAVANLSFATSLPQVGDFRFNNYGLGIEKSWLEDRFFPRRGALLDFELSIGNKTILVNTAIPANLYEGMDLKTLQYTMRGSLEKYFYWNARWGLFSRFSAGIMDNPNLFVNDLFRMGGLRSIRGFNENYFFADKYAFINFEPRYYFDTYSYFMIFADVGRLNNRLQQLPLDYPISAGLGFSLETASGIFNFIYALGGSNTQEFALNFSKVHFGYTGRF